VTLPNILLVVADQLRRDTSAAYGNHWVDTPAFDGLAADAAVFDHCYVTQPVCAPSRASILTGRYPQGHGVTTNGKNLPAEVPVLAELLPDAYATAHVGKWHLGDDAVPQHGFDHWVSVEDWRRRYTRPEYRELEPDYHHFLRVNGITPPPPDSSYEEWLPGADLPEHLTQGHFSAGEAVRFIAERADEPGDRPWLLTVSFFEPHPPYTGPLDDLHDPDDVVLGPAFLAFPENGSLVNRLRAAHYLGGNMSPLAQRSGDHHDLTSETGWRRLIARYHGNVALFDRQLARLLAALDATGQADSTIVVVTSDHGEMLGDHGLLEKRCLYEASVGVPLVIRDPRPGAVRGRIRGNFGHVDLVPTLLEMAGAPIPDDLPGTSRADVVGGRAALDDADAFIQWNGGPDRDLGTEDINRMTQVPWRSVVSADRWKLNLSAEDSCELYDLTADPYELTNRFDDPDQTDRVKDLAGRIRRWQEASGDDIALPAV
jgi:arylsulfatase A-like enzyme